MFISGIIKMFLEDLKKKVKVKVIKRKRKRYVLMTDLI